MIFYNRFSENQKHYGRKRSLSFINRVRDTFKNKTLFSLKTYDNLDVIYVRPYVIYQYNNTIRYYFYNVGRAPLYYHPDGGDARIFGQTTP